MKEEPVSYCGDCLSLRIKYLGAGNDCYCDECGSSDIKEDEFDNWEEKYKERYGYKFLKSNKHGRAEKKDRKEWSDLWKR